MHTGMEAASGERRAGNDEEKGVPLDCLSFPRHWNRREGKKRIWRGGRGLREWIRRYNPPDARRGERMTVGTLQIDGRKFRVVPEEQYRAMSAAMQSQSST